MSALRRTLLAQGTRPWPNNVPVYRRFLSSSLPTRQHEVRQETLKYHPAQDAERNARNHSEKHGDNSADISVKDLKKSQGGKSLPQRNLSARKAYIAIGSNIGNRVDWIEKALAQLKLTDGRIDVKRVSSLWETEPMYVTDQEKFLNGVIEVFTALRPFLDHYS